MSETTAMHPVHIQPAERTFGPVGVLAATWGVLGVIALIGNAVVRLTPVALEAVIAGRLGALQWTLLAGNVAFMAFSEGYRGFQRGFAPRVVSRAVHLAANPRPHLVVLAPLFCMGLVHASRRRLITSWSLTSGIVVLVMLVRLLEQPWRGIVDAGVVAGLVWGLVALVAFAARAVAGRPPAMAVELPAGERTGR